MKQRCRCREWLGPGAHLESHHQWEHETGNLNRRVVCSLCGTTWEDFDTRAQQAREMYLEAYGR